jgi:ABC-type transport system substrate-binding protein
MQMAIDLPELSKSYYNGTIEPYPATLTSRYMEGWGFHYEDWPQDLKDEYAYNPAAAKKLLAEAGHAHGFKTNIVVQADSDMGLLKIVQSYFAQVGIEMETISTTSWHTAQWGRWAILPRRIMTWLCFRRAAEVIGRWWMTLFLMILCPKLWPRSASLK